MKKNHYSFLGLLVMFFITSSTIESPESKRLFEKIVFVELTPEKDSGLFQPYSKAWDETWNQSGDIVVEGSELMDAKKYQSSFENRTENLYTILHPMIINGTIRSYYPSDPATFGLGRSDEGELRYPVGDKEANETFLNSEEVQNELCYLLGRFGPMSDLPLIDEYGDPILITEPDGTQSYKYPPRDFDWYTDKDIIKYKLRVSVLFDKKGKEKKRIIKAICPVVDRIDIDPSGKEMIVGEDELVWLNFEDLRSTLEDAHFLDPNEKSVSYLKYFQKKVKNASLWKKSDKT